MSEGNGSVQTLARARALLRTRITGYMTEQGVNASGVSAKLKVPRSSVRHYLQPGDEGVVPSPAVAQRLAEQLPLTPEDLELLRRAHDIKKAMGQRAGVRGRQQRAAARARNIPTKLGVKRVLPLQAVTPQPALTTLKEQVAMLWKVFGPLAQTLAPQAITIERAYAHWAKAQTDDEEFLLRAQNFLPISASAAEVEEFVAHTLVVLAQAQACLAVLAQLPNEAHDKALAKVKGPIGRLWGVFKIARSLAPEEVLFEMNLSDTLSGRR